MRRPRQRMPDDLLDRIEAQRQLGEGLAGEIIAQAVIVVHFKSVPLPGPIPTFAPHRSGHFANVGIKDH